MLAGTQAQTERVSAALALIERSWPAHEERFGWRMLARRLNCRYEHLCRIRRGEREPPKQVLLSMLRVARQAGVILEVLDILTEDSESQLYSQPASSRSGRVSPRDWVQRRARTTSRY